MRLFCQELEFSGYCYCCGYCPCVHFLFFSHRCKSGDFCVACTTRHEHYVIIHRSGTVEQKETLVSDAGGAIFPGEIL